MASLSDILTTAQNLVQAVYAVGQQIARGQGTLTSATVTTATQICTGAGYLVSVAVVAKGSGAGTISNSGSVAGVAASNALMTVPTTAEQIILSGQAFTAGLAVTPGTGQSLNVTYFQT